MSRFKIFLFLITVCLFETTVSSVVLAKPRPVIELFFQKTEVLQDQTLITLTLRANLELREADLSMDLPLGLSVITGESKWQGALKAGSRKVLKVVIEAGSGFMRVVEARASVRFLDGSVLTKTQRLDLNEQVTPAPPAPIWQRGDDGGVLEFRAP